MISAPVASLVFMVLGSGFFMSFISLYLKKQGLTEFAIGLTQSAFYFGLLVSSLRSEKLIARVGHIRALTAACGLLTTSTLVLFLIPLQYWVWLRILAGICVGCFYVGVESWLLAEYAPDKRGHALAIYTISLYLAQATSQLFLQLTDNIQVTAFVVSAALTSLAVIPMSLGRGKGPEPVEAGPGSLLKFFKLSPLGILGCFFAGMTLSTLYAFMPVFIEEKGFSPGYLMTTMILGGALLQWPIGKLSDRTERRMVLIILAAAGALCLLLLSFMSGLVPFAATLFLLGGLSFTVYPVAMALGCDCVAPRDLVKMTGILLFAYGLGAVLGPSVTPLFRHLSSYYLIIMLILYSLTLLLSGVYVRSIKKPLDVSSQSEFTVIPTGPMVDHLHPAFLDLNSSGKTQSDNHQNEAVESKLQYEQ